MDIRESMLQSGNDAYNDIVGAFEDIVDLVHSEGGWIVYRWGKRGLINDVSLLGNYIKEHGYNKVLSQEILTDVLHLHLSKKYYLGLSKIMGRGLSKTSNLTYQHYKYVIAINKMWACHYRFIMLIYFYTK